ncbi:F-box/WD repeat-containing protein 7-like [Topomyia yanbarensis]|uniref:F-box/WD repeat-containing protein 7-like n=1 Tax=Topomyia yanbarensis TaxID=2498891 RepID=UPI00273B4249|nr:F-box/WD repeat-containing protein 7-like [Topomyia yanbarensis]
MKVIEPQFQRDFSLLLKELTLQVLSYLEPKDLLRAAQTCRNWCFLAEKRKEAVNMMKAMGGNRLKRGRAGNLPSISSQWKAAYMRQHIMELKWRSRPIRTAMVLKGHDDHVITCLQFCRFRQQYTELFKIEDQALIMPLLTSDEIIDFSKDRAMLIRAHESIALDAYQETVFVRTVMFDDSAIVCTCACITKRIDTHAKINSIMPSRY